MRVLFVCVHNSGRSQMAEAYTNFLATKEGQNVFAESAGTMGGKELNSVAVQAMNEVSVSMSGQQPKLLTKEMVDRADKIISMGCGVDAEACPTKFLVTEDWELDDPAGQDIERVRKIRDEIFGRVEILVKEAK